MILTRIQKHKLAKCENLLVSEFVKSDERLLDEIRTMKRIAKKCEIQHITNTSNMNFLSEFVILCCKREDYIDVGTLVG
jgi:hypothetical protein